MADEAQSFTFFRQGISLAKIKWTMVWFIMNQLCEVPTLIRSSQENRTFSNLMIEKLVFI